MSEEHEIYNSGRVRVTNLRAILGSKTYAASSITSVSMTQKAPPYAILLLVLIVGVSVATYAVVGADGIRWPGLIVGGLLFGGALIRIDNSRPSYVVRIGSASGESDALNSQDREQIREVFQALKEAIIEQG